MQSPSLIAGTHITEGENRPLKTQISFCRKFKRSFREEMTTYKKKVGDWQDGSVDRGAYCICPSS